MKNLIEYLKRANIKAGNLEGEDESGDSRLPELVWAESGMPDVTNRAVVAAKEHQRLKKLPWPDYNNPNYWDLRAQRDNDIKTQRTILSEECPVSLDKFKRVYAEGGNEGEGEYVERVWEYLPTGRLIRATANYYSYDGISEWSAFEYVEAYQKTITAYRTVKETTDDC